MPDCVKLNGTQLKIFAALLMVVDHIGAVLFPQMGILRIIGRLSFPIFCYFVAEGIAHTKNIKKYLLRLFVAGVVSQPFFSLCIVGNISFSRMNVMFTFFFAALIARIYERLAEKKKWQGFLLAAILALLSDYWHFDYGDYGIVLVLVYYFLREQKWVSLGAGGVFQVLCGEGIQRYSVMSTIPLLFYNGKPGKGLKYFFYIFYPVHFLIIYLLGQWMQ